MMGKRLIGLIGAGMISRHHLTAWSRSPDDAVVAICDPDLAKARARASEFSIPGVYADAAAMLQREELDGIDVASPRELHAEHVRLGADRGLAVLCQKPLTPTYDESLRLVRDIAGKCRLMVHENWRFRPFYRLARDWLQQGRIGRLRGATMLVRGSGFRPDADGRYPALERQPFMRELPQMLVSESQIHQLDVLRCLLGPLEVRGAWLGRSCPAIRGEDRAVVTMETADHVPVILDADGAAFGYPPRSADDLEILGTKGAIRFRNMKLSAVDAAGCEEHSYESEPAYQDSFDACIRHFSQALSRGTPFETDPADNLKTLHLVDSIYRLAGPIRESLS